MRGTRPGESSQDGELATPAPLVLSPLPCPCRTFLTSLISASNFVQDRCYSDRAWVKFSGLALMSRCERALDDGNSVPANNLQNRWSDLEAMLICRLRVGPLEVECSLRLEQHSNAQIFPVVLTPPKSPPKHICDHILTPATPLLVQYPASSISPVAPIIPFSSDYGRYYRTSVTEVF